MVPASILTSKFISENENFIHSLSTRSELHQKASFKLWTIQGVNFICSVLKINKKRKQSIVMFWLWLTYVCAERSLFSAESLETISACWFAFSHFVQEFQLKIVVQWKLNNVANVLEAAGLKLSYVCPVNIKLCFTWKLSFINPRWRPKMASIQTCWHNYYVMCCHQLRT